MTYDRDQVIATVADYYVFLTRLHVEPKDIRKPPPGGWPQISQERLHSLGKTDKVLDLMKHLPYVQNDDNFDPILVWTMSGCNDFTGQEFQRDMETGRESNMFPEDTGPEDCTWEKLHKPHPHIVPLASPSYKYGDYVLCDTEDGEFVIWSFFDEDGHRSFPNVEACFAYLKRTMLETRVFPLKKTYIRPLTENNRANREIKQLLRELGWPSDGFSWDSFISTAKEKIEDFSNIARYD